MVASRFVYLGLFFLVDKSNVVDLSCHVKQLTLRCFTKYFCYYYYYFSTNVVIQNCTHTMSFTCLYLFNIKTKQIVLLEMHKNV